MGKMKQDKLLNKNRGRKGNFQELIKLKYFEMRKKIRESKQTVF